MSSQDGSNRSQRAPRTSGQPRRPDVPRRRNQTWDVDPAEIDRYLSGRPTRSEESTTRPPRRSGTTADQLSRLQDAVGRRQPADEPAAAPGETYRGPAAQPRRTPARRQPDPVEYDDVAEYDAYPGEPVGRGAGDAAQGAEYGYEDDEYDDEVAWEQPQPAPQPRQRSARVTPQRSTQQRPARQQPVRRYEPEPVDVYDETGYDDEFYNDDPYLGYEDEQIDRRPPRAPRPRNRQQVKLSKPNLPKVTIPKSVTDSPLLADTASLVMIGLSIVSVALMAFLVSDRISLLGDTIPTHVSASGDPENLRTRDAVWNIPLLAGMVMLMSMAASWFISRIDRFASRFLLAGGLLVHFIAWVALFKYLWE